MVLIERVQTYFSNENYLTARIDTCTFCTFVPSVQVLYAEKTDLSIVTLKDTIVCAWRRMKEFAAIVAIMYLRRYGRHKWEKR